MSVPAASDVPHLPCWYSRRSARIPPDLRSHSIEDGLLVYCAHPMLFPIVGFHFDSRNCEACEYYRPVRARQGRL